MKPFRENLAPLALGFAIGLTAGGAIPAFVGRHGVGDPGVSLGLGVALGGIISILSSWGFSWWYFRKGGLVSAVESAQRR
jgi:hypothetical protein